MPRRGEERTAPGEAPPPAAVPRDLGYALQYRKPKMAFHETRQALGYLEDLRAVLELTVSGCSMPEESRRAAELRNAVTADEVAYQSRGCFVPLSARNAIGRISAPSPARPDSVLVICLTVADMFAAR